MRPGTFIRLPDGREGTVVYHGPDGYGIKWGCLQVDEKVIRRAQSLFSTAPPDWPWSPEAMLRDPYPGAILECVGEEYDRDDVGRFKTRAQLLTELAAALKRAEDAEAKADKLFQSAFNEKP